MKIQKFKLKPTALSTSAVGSFAVLQLLQKVDPRTRSIITGIGGVGLVASGILGRANPTITNIGAGVMIASLTDLLNSIRGAYIVENLYNKPVYYKPEKSDNPVKLEPFETPGIFTPVDGVATPVRNGFVYKIPTACIAKIDKNGNVLLASRISEFINSTRPVNERANWYDHTWQFINNGWQPLLNISRTL